jgi:hypothetical protein
MNETLETSSESTIEYQICIRTGKLQDNESCLEPYNIRYWIVLIHSNYVRVLLYIWFS